MIGSANVNTVLQTRPGRGELSPSLEISNAMVRLYKEAFGRGPTKVRTTFAGPDTVLVLLEDAFTVAERTMLALGRIDELRNSRLVVQEALEEGVRSAVEAALGRRTVAFITGVDQRHGTALNVLTLEPVAGRDGHREADGTQSVC
jgi:uncharacterized protein YbcI